MQKISLLLLIGVILFSCNNHKTIKTERKGEPAIYTVTDDDEEMNIAILKARQTLGKFKEALNRNDSTLSAFAIKEKFPASTGSEHIWIDDIILKDDKYFGIVGNTPELTKEVKLGDTVEINNDKISDWMYLENRKLRGGYTLRLLRNRMTIAERVKFDTESNFIIDDVN